MSSSVFYNHGAATRFRKRKARFSRSEVHILLKEVRKNRMVVVGKLNRGVPSDVKKRTWAEITARINEIGECRREVIEVVKKWSDLKCDTKRKVAAMQAGKLHNRGLNSRACRELNQTEKIVHSILEMRDEDQSSENFGPLEEDDDLLEEEMEEEELIALKSLPNGPLNAPRAPERTTGGSRASTTNMEGNEGDVNREKIFDAPKRTHKSNVWHYFGFFQREGKLDKTHVICKQCRVAIKYAGNTTNLAKHMRRRHGVDTSAAAPPSSPSDSAGAPDTPSGGRAGDRNNAAFGDSDEDQKADVLPYSQLVKQTENHKGNNGLLKPGPPQTFSRPLASSSHKEAMLQSVSLSVQEQHTTNLLLETVSRSLELLSESVQQLAETQQEFVRESLQIQRETVQVLRDFTGGAIALMHDKLNGRPAL